MPTVSSVIKKELIELGVPSSEVLEENKSGSTYEELIRLKKYLAKNKYKEVIIISNKYHLPRIKTMISYLPKIKILKNKVKLVSAENILIKYGEARWKKLIATAYKSSLMKKRVRLEQKGIRDIKNKTYQFK